jgi:hypothetical protein
MAISSCGEDEKIAVPVVQQTPPPASEPTPQEILASKGIALVILENNSKANIENIQFVYKYSRSSENGGPPYIAYQFPQAFVAPGNFIKLEVQPDLYKKVTCVQRGSTRRIYGELVLNKGQIFTIEVK